MADTFRVDIAGVPHYADINPPPAGTTFPPNTTPATVAQVEDRVNTNASYDSNSNTWVVPTTNASTANASGTTGGNGTGDNAGAVVTTGATTAKSVTTSTGDNTGPLSWPGPYEGNPTVVTQLKPLTNTLLGNPLNKYASYTYGWSLWWLDVGDYNTLTTFKDVQQAQNWSPTVGKSFVLAEDGGRYPDQRLPTTSGLNYNIQSVNFTTVISPNKQSQSTNLITGKMNIKEPYGVTLIDALVLQSFASKSPGGVSSNYLDQPYMLQLDFFGYDDAGNPIDKGIAALNLRKRFPIKITSIKLEVGTGGTDYNLSFVPINHIALHEEYANVPKGFQVSGKTVGEVFTNLANELKQHWSDHASQGVALYADGIMFDFEPSIRDSKIVFSKDESIADANPQGITLDLSKKQFNIAEGTKIIDLITRIVSSSEFIINQIQKQGGFNSSHTNSFNIFKIQTGVKFGAQGNTDAIQFAVFDPVKNQYPKIITFNVFQYTTWMANHPAMDQAPDSSKHTIKQYDYLYSGYNNDILNLRLNFDTTYYTQVLANKKTFAAYQASPEVAVNAGGGAGPNYNVSPTLLAIRYPGLANVVNITPSRYIGIVNDQNLTTWGGVLNSPLAQTGADIFKSLYSQAGGDMLVVDLTIRGDPHLIKQDDWYYTASPSATNDYTANTSNSAFTSKYGFARMDMGELVVALNIYTPIDQDADLTGVGLAYWEGGAPSPTRSLFSGQYRILNIQNKFENGKFEQQIKLARYPQGDLGKVLGGTVALNDRGAASALDNAGEVVATNSGTTNTGSDASARV
jgi:hypothetical protein